MYKSFKLMLNVALVAIAVASSPQDAVAEDDPTEVAAATIDEKYSEYKMDVKRLFATRCSRCHHGYGMVRADGPRLAGTIKNRDQVVEQIANGKSRMPGFRTQLKPYQLEALADYIKELPSE